jgi:hypothetical protein
MRVVTHDWSCLGKVKPLPLREPLNDVNQNDIGEPGFCDALCGGGAHVPCADDGDLATLNLCHEPSSLGSIAEHADPTAGAASWRWWPCASARWRPPRFP